MQFRLLPKENKFFVMLDKQGQLLMDAMDTLKEIFCNYENVREKCEKIAAIEDESDEIFHDITTSMYKTFVTPIDREDIHLLTSCLDDIIALFQALAKRMVLYRIDCPTPNSLKLIEIAHKCSQLVVHGLKRLPKFENMKDLQLEVKGLEKSADDIYRTSISELFINVNKNDIMDLIKIIKWKELYERLDDIIDKTDEIYDVLETVIVKHA